MREEDWHRGLNLAPSSNSADLDTYQASRVWGSEPKCCSRALGRCSIGSMPG
jgi:hypothetical protein